MSKQAITHAGVRRVPRTAGVSSGRPQLNDGQVLDVAAVIWATGFRPDFSWIDLPICDQRGHLLRARAAAPRRRACTSWAYTSSLL